MKEIIDFLKTLWSNKRTRALVILIIYFLFFAFVFMFISAYKTPSIPSKPLSSLDIFENIDRYHYKIIKEDTLEGVYHETLSIYYKKEMYTLENLPSIFDEYYISFWNPSNLRKIVEQSTLVSTNYLERKDTYQLDTLKHPDLIPLKNITNVIIDVYKKEDTIYKIVIEEKEIPFRLEWEIE